MLSQSLLDNQGATESNLAERRFAALVRASAQIVWLAAPDGMVIEDSPTWREFTGQSEDQFLGHGWLDAIHPDDRNQTRTVWNQAVRSRTRYSTTYRMHHRTLGWRWTTARGYPVFTDGGGVDCWVGLNNDVTERRQALAKLEESETQFRTLAETTPNLIWVADANAHVYYWNASWLSYTGLTLEQSLGLSAAEVIREDVRSRALAEWLKAVEAQTSYEIELPLRSAAGDYQWFIAKARPIRNSVGEVTRWCGVMTNIHSHKMMTSALRTERRNRERFVSTLVHDLKNAFGTGKVAMTTLTELAADDDQRQEYEKLVLRAFDRAGRMVEDLLDANQIEAGQTFPLKSTETFHLRSIIGDVARSVGRASGRVISLEIDVDLEVRWSAKDLTRIVENLLSNAVKYGDKEREITIGARARGDRVVWWVHNWGEPIPAAEQTHLFRFLERSNSARDGGEEGWGIGLTLVKGLVEAHGGTIRVESSAHEGTSFISELPSVVTI